MDELTKRLLNSYFILARFGKNVAREYGMANESVDILANSTMSKLESDIYKALEEYYGKPTE